MLTSVSWEAPPSLASQPRDGHLTHVIQDTNDSVDLNSVRQGQYQEKEKNPSTELNIFLFRRKITSTP